MNTPDTGLPRRKTARPRQRAWALTLVGLLGAAGILGAAVPAQAQSLNAITGVTLTTENGSTAELDIWQSFGLAATWAVPDTAREGDTFTLAYPTQITGYAASFPLLEGSGREVGTCVVTSENFTCTLGSYVNTHTGVGGTLWLTAMFNTAFSGDVTFIAGGSTPILLSPPGGGVGEGEPGDPGAPYTEPVKWGWPNVDGTSLTWYVAMPGNLIVPGTTYTDTFDPGLTLDPQSLSFFSILDSAWAEGTRTEIPRGTTGDTVNVQVAPGNTSFSVTYNAPNTSGDRTYGFIYTTSFAAGTAAGTVFGNRVSAQDREVVSGQTHTVTSGGTGSGVDTPTPSPSPSESVPAPSPTPPVPSPSATPPSPVVVPAPPASTPPAPGPILPPGTGTPPASVLAGAPVNALPGTGGSLPTGWLLAAAGVIALGLGLTRLRRTPRAA